MQKFHSQFQEIVSTISSIESERIKFGEFLRKSNNSLKIGPNEEISDCSVINKVPENPFEKISVLGIDGGIVKRSFHGLDLMLTRAVGVNFVYNSKKLENVKYFPSSNPLPDPRVFLETFSDIELNSCYNFERQIMEIDTCIKSIKEFKPDIVFLDGSVIPHYVSKPDNVVLKNTYSSLIEKYKELFEISKKNKIILAGVVEDSRGIKFCDVLSRRLVPQIKDVSRELKMTLEKTKDSNLLFYVLKKGERTCVFNYSKNPNAHPILNEFENYRNSFFSFYIKTVEFDRPIRIDFINFGNEIETADKISSLLMHMSGHSGYGIPSVIIEADQRAKLSEKDIEMFYSDLISSIGNISSLFRMRREMRPF